jgi:hypothetical protein
MSNPKNLRDAIEDLEVSKAYSDSAWYYADGEGLQMVIDAAREHLRALGFPLCKHNWVREGRFLHVCTECGAKAGED